MEGNEVGAWELDVLRVRNVVGQVAAERDTVMAVAGAVHDERRHADARKIDRMSISVTQRYMVAEARRGMANLEYRNHQLRKRGRSPPKCGQVEDLARDPQCCCQPARSFSAAASGMPMG